MFHAEDLPLWAYIVTVAVGSIVFFHQQRQSALRHEERIAQLEARLLGRLDALERKLKEAGPGQEIRPRFRLIRTADR